MSTPQFSEIAGVLVEPKLDWTKGQKAYCRVFLAFNDSKWNPETRQHETISQFVVEGTAWEHKALQLAEAVQKGSQIWVKGQLRTDQWEKDGQKHSKPALRIFDFRVIERLPKIENNGGQSGGASTTGGFAGTGGGFAQAEQPAQDPWAQPSGGGGSWGTPQDNEPPF